jgi:hypothetical protein
LLSFDEIIIRLLRDVGDSAGYCSRSKAATPVTNGADREVPDVCMRSVSLECDRGAISSPGAAT